MAPTEMGWPERARRRRACAGAGRHAAACGPPWRDLNGRLKKRVAEAGAAEAKVAEALLETRRRGLHRCLGCSRIQDHAEVELDLRKCKAKDLIEIARRIETLPARQAAFEKGELS